jgi:hypothetical protein
MVSLVQPSSQELQPYCFQVDYSKLHSDLQTRNTYLSQHCVQILVGQEPLIAAQEGFHRPRHGAVDAHGVQGVDSHRKLRGMVLSVHASITTQPPRTPAPKNSLHQVSNVTQKLEAIDQIIATMALIVGKVVSRVSLTMTL